MQKQRYARQPLVELYQLNAQVSNSISIKARTFAIALQPTVNYGAKEQRWCDQKQTFRDTP